MPALWSKTVVGSLQVRYRKQVKQILKCSSIVAVFFHLVS